MRRCSLNSVVVCVAVVLGCGGGDETSSPPTPAPITTQGGPSASVTAVEVTGSAGAYTFGATVRSDETGCDQYADWWEVVTPDGQLVYRRILNHSHPDEQPFLRTGGPVDVQPDEELVVRAHLHPTGFGAQAMRGTAGGGFAATELASDFAAELATAAPLPESCWF